MNDEPNAEGAPRPPRHPLLRRFLAARIGASLVLGCFGCAVAVWFLTLSLRHQPVRPAGWYVPPALAAVFAVLAGHVLRKVRAWLGPGVDVAWTPAAPAAGEAFELAWWPFGRRPAFDEVRVDLRGIDSRTLEPRVKQSFPAFFHPDAVTTTVERERHLKELVSPRDFVRHPAGGSVHAAVPRQSPGLPHVPIDGWRIRVECRRGGRVVFSEERPFPLSLTPDAGGESPGEPK